MSCTPTWWRGSAREHVAEVLVLPGVFHLHADANLVQRLLEIHHLGAQPFDHHRFRRTRSEEHTSELQSLRHLVCRLLLEKKKKKTKNQAPREPKNMKPRTTDARMDR